MVPGQRLQPARVPVAILKLNYVISPVRLYNRFTVSRGYEEGHGGACYLVHIGALAVYLPICRYEVYGYNKYRRTIIGSRGDISD